MPNYPASQYSYYDQSGFRKYINADERERFTRIALQAEAKLCTFCLVILYTGCRISEALALNAGAVQIFSENGVIAFRTLKKRDKYEVREIPIPKSLCELLEKAHSIKAIQRDMKLANATRLWQWERTHAWKCIKAIMKDAGITGPQASPKGLRHGFCVHALMNGVPLNAVKVLAGHAHISTTLGYTAIVGKEQMAIASRMWSDGFCNNTNEHEKLSLSQTTVLKCVDCGAEQFLVSEHSKIV